MKYFALGALGAATIRLVFNPALLHYYPRSGLPIFNWILYTYLVPVAALLGSAALLRPLEVSRARPRERDLYRYGRPVAAMGVVVAAIAVFFVWINLAVADWFTEGPALTLRFGRLPARDLTLSIAWTLYALGLLVAGLCWKSVGLRWISLAFLVAMGRSSCTTWGSLRDLYRVASLVGLAVSLLVVSVLYQRFVFGRRETGGGAAT